ncbi:hypothetical protein [Paenibacillus sp. FSL E2-0201]|uniref:hypothetical protein n=1 Tax=Paenibacillus sp. FSL E2-0201 TaxID=2954726 RepID=UPI0030DD7A02
MKLLRSACDCPGSVSTIVGGASLSSYPDPEGSADNNRNSDGHGREKASPRLSLLIMDILNIS